jgi:prepilin-type N-terminal cleavage/methylation domain-containing protein
MNERGVTILELIVALAIGTVVMLGAGALYRTATWSAKEDFSEAHLQNQASLVVAEIQRQVEAASTIAACYPGSDCIVAECDGQNGSTAVSTFLYVAQPDGSIYCFYRTTDGRFMQYRQPASGSSGHWNMLSPSAAPLIVTDFDICGLPIYGTCQSTADIAYVSFRLQATGLPGGASAAPKVAFSLAVAKRN